MLPLRVHSWLVVIQDLSTFADRRTFEQGFCFREMGQIKMASLVVVAPNSTALTPI